MEVCKPHSHGIFFYFLFYFFNEEIARVCECDSVAKILKYLKLFATNHNRIRKIIAQCK